MSLTNARIWLQAINASFCAFLLGFNLGFFNVSQTNISQTLEWGDNEELLVSLSTGFLFVGGWCGSLVSTKLGDKLGRRKTLMSALSICLAGVLCLCIPSTPTFLMGRFLVGITTGISLSIAPLYISEMTPPSMTGKTGSLFGLQYINGLVASALLGLLLPEDEEEDTNVLWVPFYAIQSLVVVPQLVLLKWVFTYDTPQWYMITGNGEKAIETMNKLKRTDIITNPNLESEEQVSLKELLCTVKYSKVMRVGFLMAMISAFSGLVFYNVYSTFIFKEIGFSMFYSRLFTLFLVLSEYIGFAFVFCFINKFGRKKLFLSGLFFVGVDLFAIGFIIEYMDAPYAVVVLSILYKIAFAISMNSVLFLYLSEILGANQLGIVYSLRWISNILLGFFTLVSVDLIGLFGNYFFYGSVSVIVGFILTADMHETQGLTREEIKDKYLPVRAEEEIEVQV